MGTRPSLWWQYIKKHWIVALTIILSSLTLGGIILGGYWFNWAWTGFGPETSEPKQHAKTLWDWMQLLVIPVVLAVGGYVFNLTTSRNEQEAIKQRTQSEREAAEKLTETEREIA